MPESIGDVLPVVVVVGWLLAGLAATVESEIRNGSHLAWFALLSQALLLCCVLVLAVIVRGESGPPLEPVGRKILAAWAFGFGVFRAPYLVFSETGKRGLRRRLWVPLFVLSIALSVGILGGLAEVVQLRLILR